MTLESDVVALPARTLWLRARDIAASSGSILHWRSYDGEVATQSIDGTAIGSVNASAPPLSPKSVRFLAGANVRPFAIGRAQAHTGVVEVAASSTYPGYTPYTVINGVDNVVSEWASNSAADSITIEYATGFVATQVYICGRPSFSTQNPKDWTLQGSNDGSSWTTLDTRTGANPGSGTNYTFSNATSYRFYKLDVTAVQSGGANVGIRIIRILPASGGPFRDLLNSTGAGEVWAVVKSGSTGKGGPFKFGASVETFPASHYPWTDGTIYNDFGATTRRAITPAATLTNWHILRMSMSATGTLTVQINGVTKTTQAGLTTGYQSDMVIGGGNLLGTYGSDVYIAELLTFSDVLDGSAVTAVSDYLTDSHFVSLAPPAGTHRGWGVVLNSRAVSFAAKVNGKAPGAYWRLDETSGLVAADASGNSRPLTASVAPEWGGFPSGAHIGGYSATGFTTATRMKSASGLFGEMTSFTFMAAIQTSGTAAGHILARDASSGSADRQFQFGMSSGRLTLTTFTPANAPTTVQATAAMNDERWHLVFGLWTGTQLRLRSAKADLAAPVAFTSLRTGTTEIFLGLRYQGAGGTWVNPFVGSLDEVAIWPNVVLSDADMDELHDVWAA